MENKKQQLHNRIKSLILENKDGFTASKEGYKLNLNKGFSCAITNNSNKDIDFLIDNLFRLVKKHKVKFYNIGGWFSASEGLYYLDIAFYSNKLTRSLSLALKNNQLSIFSFENYSCIDTNREKLSSDIINLNFLSEEK